MTKLLCCIAAGAIALTAANAELVFTREEFDAKDARIDSLRDFANASSDEFAWGESYHLRGYVEMYLATQDADYLRRLVRVSDAIIAMRPDRRAAAAGETAPATWPIGGKYTVARLTLKDQAGNDAIALRGIRSGSNNETVVEVVPGEQPGAFTFIQSNETYKSSNGSNVTYQNLSLDPASARYFPRMINNPNNIADPSFTRSDEPDAVQSLLLVAEDIRADKSPTDRLAAVAPTKLVPDTVYYPGYTGPVFSAMTRFAQVVYADAGLRDEFLDDANRLLRAARESVDAWEPLWRDGPAPGQGYYLSIEKGGGLWWDGVMAPMNYLGALGQVLLNLHDCVGDQRALEHATAIANLLKSDCTLRDNGSYSFGYWPAVLATIWVRENDLSVNTPHYPSIAPPDDVSHGAWSLEFAVMCYERGIVFDRTDMERLARTFAENIWREPDADGTHHFALRVDGTRVGSAGSDIAGARWLDLCTIEPRIFEMNRRVWEANELQKSTYGHAIGSYGRMYRWQEELEGGE